MERGGNLGRLEIQFKTDRVLVVRTFSLSEFSTKAIETTETEINRERERARINATDSILDHRCVETTRGKRWRR